MAYNKYNNRRNGYKTRNNNYRPQQPRYNNRPVNGFDASQFKKPDIEIKDLNGKVYKISGNFSTAFAAKLVKTSEQVTKMQNASDKKEQFTEVFDIMRNWCLELINLNVEKKVYTIEDINAGFNDIHVLTALMKYIQGIIAMERPQGFNN